MNGQHAPKSLNAARPVRATTGIKNLKSNIKELMEAL